MNLNSEIKFLAGLGIAGLAGFTALVNIGDPMQMPSIPIVSSITPIIAKNGFGDYMIVSHSEYRTRNTVAKRITEISNNLSRELKGNVDDLEKIQAQFKNISSTADTPKIPEKSKNTFTDRSAQSCKLHAFSRSSGLTLSLDQRNTICSEINAKGLPNDERARIARSYGIDWAAYARFAPKQAIPSAYDPSLAREEQCGEFNYRWDNNTKSCYTVSGMTISGQTSGISDVAISKFCGELAKQIAVNDVSFTVGMKMLCHPGNSDRDQLIAYEKYCSRTQYIPCNKGNNGL